MKTHRPHAKRASLALVFLLLLSTVATVVEAGAGRSRPGGGGGSRGGGGGGGGGGRSVAAGRASYGYGGGVRHGGRGFYGYPGWYGGWGWGWGLGWGHPYGLYYPYSWWHWGWATVPQYVAPYNYAVDSDAPGAIETDVRPKKADVYVDGEWLGEARDYNGRYTPLWLDSGTHNVEFRREGYMTLRRTIRLRPGMQVRIDDRLAKGEGEDPRSDPPAAPGSLEPAPEPRSEPRFDVERPASSLAKALLRLDVEPGDAAVYLDGEFLARGEELARLHGALPVAVGTHRLEVVRPGYESQAIEIELSGEEPERVEIRLRRSGDPG